MCDAPAQIGSAEPRKDGKDFHPQLAHAVSISMGNIHTHHDSTLLSLYTES